MRAMTLKNKILDLREWQSFELENAEYKQYLIVEGESDGWSISLPGSSIMLRFNEATVSGNDLYLIKEEEGGEGERHIFAVLDADKWEVCGGGK